MVETPARNGGPAWPARDLNCLTRVCDEAELAACEVKTLAVQPPVSVWNVDGEFLATDDICTHEEYSLAEGYIEGGVVECALHWAKFDLRTGEALSLPAIKPLATYPVVVENGVVYVDISARA